MTRASGPHAQHETELIVAYALQTLAASDAAGAAARIASCADCRRELETLEPVVRSFVAWPIDVLRPAASLWNRLAERIAAETGEPLLDAPALRPEPAWQEAAPGISVKLLATDTEKNRVSMLVRLAPGTDYPRHRHTGVEELHLLDGELMIDGRKLSPGDYNRAEPGTVDHRVWSETGCTCVLLTSFDDAIL